jgi:hypothetical protein
LPRKVIEKMNVRCSVAGLKVFAFEAKERAELATKERYKSIAYDIRRIRHLPDEEGERILDRIRKEQDEKYRKEIEKEKIRLGNVFVKSRIYDFKMVRIEAGDGQVGVGALRVCGKNYCAACFMTPQDSSKIRWSNEKAVGLVGFRIMESLTSVIDNDLVFDLSYDATPEQVLSLAGHTLVTKALKDDRSVPSFFRRSVQRGEKLILHSEIELQ